MAAQSPARADQNDSTAQSRRAGRFARADEVDVASGNRPARRFPRDEVDDRLTALLRGLPWPGGKAADAVKTLGLTGCCGGEGVSTLAARLSVRAAQLSAREVLLVEANLARPALARMFDLPAGPGLTDVLLDGCERAAAIRRTRLPRLAVLPAGEHAVLLDEVGDRSRLAELVAACKDDFELTIFDLPPAGEVVSAACLAGLLDGVVLVVEADQTRWEAAQRVTRQLTRANARLLGAVLNRRRHRAKSWLESGA
ncbi:MAG TPA: CpsD/CapB family tyrosine-protein kinase [Pirellulales bacterium]|nr:CpsD/CapB family tyrosine-protein kinase [Pirellulales bacterium]